MLSQTIPAALTYISDFENNSEFFRNFFQSASIALETELVTEDNSFIKQVKGR